MKLFLVILLASSGVACSSTRKSQYGERSAPEIVVATPKQGSGQKGPQTPATPVLAPLPIEELERTPQTDEQLGNLISSYTAARSWLSVLSLYEIGIQQPQLAKHHETYYEKASQVIDSKLVLEEILAFTEQAKTTRLKSTAWFRAGELNLESRDFDGARKYFGRCMAIVEEPTRSERARQILDQLDNLRRVEPKTVGIVLPLTGKYSAISQKILRGVQLGLGLGRKVPTSFKLAVIDSEGNPDQARRGVERLIKEDNVIAIIGGVTSKTAMAEATTAAELGVPFLTLAQRAGLTDAGQTVFRNSITSEMQVRFLVKTAMEDLGLSKFAIVYPNDAYGVEYANIFWDEVLARGGEIGSVQTYSNKETDFSQVVQRLVGTYYIEARADEYRIRQKIAADANPNKRKSERTSSKDNSDVLPAVVDFDAVFIPDGAKAMGQISAMLSYHEVRGVKLLGTNLWNSQGLAKRAGLFGESLLFVDGFLPNDKVITETEFFKTFKSSFPEDPGLFEIQGYDSSLLIRQLVTQGSTNREQLNQALHRLKDFPGALGELSMTEDREILRPMVALTLSGGNVVPFSKDLLKK